ncbi:MAG: transglycosylase SLT domain-containing protein, partial [Bdellovibrionales bacterium]|nr:transglycosylase SLT domain-containing protein [Bdellovibrionales bacterium]
ETTTNPFAAVRTFNQVGAKEGALTELYKISDESLSKENREWKYFELGRLSYDLGRLETAQEYLHRSISEGEALAAYQHYFLGLIHFDSKRFKKAREHFQNSVRFKPPRNLIYKAQYHLARLDIEEKHWNSAYNYLRRLYRHWRGEPEQADVVWKLVRVELQRKKKRQACRWATKIYSKFPVYDKATDWGIDLQKAKYEGEVLGCVASFGDQKSRIRRLQWAGRSDQARKEIEELVKRATPKNRYQVDSMLAQFNVGEGYVSEALKILLSHYEKKKKDFSYLMLLGKAASRAGEYQAAVGSYYAAFQLSPRGRSGRKALFQAAFLSYQFQDYDGAVRKFTQFRKLFPRSGLSRDSLWHISWIKYLKGDYEGAANSFQSILTQKRRHRRRWRQFETEKIQYWLGMSYLRSDRLEKAKELFLEVAGDRLLGYYSLAAQYRLLSVPGIQMSDVLQLQGVVSRGLASMPLNPDAENLVAENGEASLERETQETQVSEEDESEESINSSEEEVVETSEDKEETEEEVGADSSELATNVLLVPWLNSKGEKETTVLSELKGKSLKKRLATAYGFIGIGDYEAAKWELYEIERKTKKTQYLKILMHAYQEVNAYNRSAYVGAIQFSHLRKQHGIKGVRYLWEYAYPQAFKSSVENWAARFQIEPELSWSIMRAETMFRATAISPVGARGLMQIMPHTARKISQLLSEPKFDSSMLNDPEINIRYGSRYLHRLSKLFEHQVPLVAAGYNAGPHRVESWLRRFGDRDMDEFIEHIPFVETRNYVKKVVRHFGVYNALYREKNLLMAWMAQPVPVKRDGPSPTRESWEDL